ncbi:MAG: squalene--hopene cyclase, partial [Pirellulales bacterium]
ANQHADGRWDADRFGAGRDRRRVGTRDYGHVGLEADNGVTGLALLAFLGNGHTHLEGDYRDTVARGLDFLLATQKSNGNLSGAADYFAMMYCHGMAALAVSEAYAMTHDERLLAPVGKAIGYTLAAQDRTSGGWRYKPGETICDTSQLGWQLMALKSAELAGIEMSVEARQGILRFLQTVASGRYGGLASYRPMNVAGERVTASMTAEALVCRQFLGLARSHPASDEAGNYIATALPGRGQSNFYYWYYATLAMFQLQGEHWERWKNALEPTLIASQRSEGELAGSWDPDAVWGGHGGRVYSTALGALCLEVYYRFLPLYVQAAQP